MPNSSNTKRPKKAKELLKAEPVAIVHARRKCVSGQNCTQKDIAVKKEIVRRLFAGGMTTVARAAEVVRIDCNTLLLWRKQDPAFAEALEEAKLAAFEALECKAYQCAMMADKNPAYQTILIKLLECLDPTGRFQRSKTAQPRELSIAEQIDKMTPEELERMYAIVPPPIAILPGDEQ